MEPARWKFTEADYDFSEVISNLSKSELQACYFYEYAQESRAVMSEIAAVRTQLKQGKGGVSKWSFGPQVQNQFQSFRLLHLSLTNDFPRTPWRRLFDLDKFLLLRMIAASPSVARDASTWRNPPLSFALNEPATTTLEMWKQSILEGRPIVSDNEPIKYGFFAVNLKYGHSLLIEVFKEYLRTFEGKAQVEFPPAAKQPMKSKPPGRKSFKDALNALAAMRLRYHCKTHAEAEAKLENTDNMLLYKSRASFNQACGRALIQFQGAFGWLDSAKPIHFTENWRRGTPK